MVLNCWSGRGREATSSSEILWNNFEQPRNADVVIDAIFSSRAPRKMSIPRYTSANTELSDSASVSLRSWKLPLSRDMRLSMLGMIYKCQKQQP